MNKGLRARGWGWGWGRQGGGGGGGGNSTSRLQTQVLTAELDLIIAMPHSHGDICECRAVSTLVPLFGDRMDWLSCLGSWAIPADVICLCEQRLWAPDVDKKEAVGPESLEFGFCCQWHGAHTGKHHVQGSRMQGHCSPPDTSP